MHLIIGKGNLGIDLKLALTKAGHRAVIFTRSSGFEWPESYPAIMELNPTHIWVTAGFGSVNECANDHAGALATHVAMPMELARNLPANVKLATFSSDYAAHELFPDDEHGVNDSPKSFYAMTKIWMERGLEWSQRPITTTFRVGSLYGQHYPERTFPGKLLAKYPKPCSLSLPENQVVPTPTWWLAERIVFDMDNLFHSRPKILHMAPSDSTTTLEWGRMILGDQYDISSSGIDPLRPVKSGLGCSLGPVRDWRLLWEHSKNFYGL